MLAYKIVNLMSLTKVLLNRRMLNKEYRILKCRIHFCGSKFIIRYSKLQIFLLSFQALFRRYGRRACGIVFGILICCMGESAVGHGEDIDRLIAAVNGKVITEGDLEMARGLNAVLFDNKDAKGRSRQSEINQLIEFELMQQELKNFNWTQEDENKIGPRMQSLRDAYAEKGGLLVLLRQLGLQETELAAYLRAKSSILKFVDFRFRTFINVTEAEIKNYYEGRFTDQLRESKIDLPELSQVSSKIEDILREEKINAALEQWISEIRRNSHIEYFNGTKFQ
jgi:hypothetical protein